MNPIWMRQNFEYRLDLNPRRTSTRPRRNPDLSQRPKRTMILKGATSLVGRNLRANQLLSRVLLIHQMTTLELSHLLQARRPKALISTGKRVRGGKRRSHGKRTECKIWQSARTVITNKRRRRKSYVNRMTRVRRRRNGKRRRYTRIRSQRKVCSQQIVMFN